MPRAGAWGWSAPPITTRHYARPFAGGDRVVADRPDQARKEARTGTTPEGAASEMARVWHEDRARADRTSGLDAKGGL